MNKRRVAAYTLVCGMAFTGVAGAGNVVCGYEEYPEGYSEEYPEGYQDELSPEIPLEENESESGESNPEYEAPEDDFSQWETEVYQEEFAETEEIAWIRNNEGASKVEDFDIPQKKEAEEAFSLPAYEELPGAVYLEVPELLQNPELPTGCESVALTMALQYEGFELQKTTIAREFLIYNRETDNTALGYIGDPFSEEGAGCFAPVIAATAADFFKDQGYDYTAYDITQSSINELLSYVAAGTPVVVWTTMYMAEPEFTREDGEYNGRTYHWYRQEHCVVLSGYDLESNTLQINDPLEGIIERDKDAFEQIYNLTGRNAVVLKANGTEEEISAAAP